VRWPVTVSSVLSRSSGCEATATSKGAWDVRTIGAEGPDTEVAVTSGAWTRTSISTWLWPWTIWADDWASRACQRLQRVTRGSSAGRRILVP